MIFAELVRIENEIATLTSAGLRLLGSSEWNIDPFRERIVALKQQLKAYAKSGCVDLGRKAPASAERAWLLAHVVQASSHLQMYNDADPKHSPRDPAAKDMDISWAVARLRKEIEVRRRSAYRCWHG